MNLRRMLALVERVARMQIKSTYRIVDLFYEPVMPLLMWGIFLLGAQGANREFANLMLGVQIIWNFSFIVQHGYNMITLEDLWNQSLKEIFTAPIALFDYLLSKIVVAVVRGFLALSLLLGASRLIFNYDAVFGNPLGLMALLISAAAVSISVGTLIDGIIVWLGHEYSFLSWSTSHIVMMLSCPFYPIDVFPSVMHPLIMAMPYYWAFEGLKTLIAGSISWHAVGMSFIMAFVYLGVGIPLFKVALNRAGKDGMLSKN